MRGGVSSFAPTLMGCRRPTWPGHGDFTALAMTHVAPSISQPSGVCGNVIQLSWEGYHGDSFIKDRVLGMLRCL